MAIICCIGSLPAGVTSHPAGAPVSGTHSAVKNFSCTLPEMGSLTRPYVMTRSEEQPGHNLAVYTADSSMRCQAFH